jgi:hypothetical protein
LKKLGTDYLFRFHGSYVFGIGTQDLKEGKGTPFLFYFHEHALLLQ